MFGLKNLFAGKSVNASLPPVITVHGVKIQEQPTENYLKTIRRLGGVLYELLDAVFPDQTPGQVLTLFMTIKQEEVKPILIQAMSILPDKALEVAASLMGTTAEHLGSLPPLKLSEVCREWWKVNNLAPFFQNVREMLTPASRTETRNGGSND